MTAAAGQSGSGARDAPPHLTSQARLLPSGQCSGAQRWGVGAHPPPGVEGGPEGAAGCGGPCGKECVFTVLALSATPQALGCKVLVPAPVPVKQEGAIGDPPKRSLPSSSPSHPGTPLKLLADPHFPSPGHVLRGLLQRTGDRGATLVALATLLPRVHGAFPPP